MQFRTCLGTLNINLSQQEISEVINRYRVTDGTGMVNYAAFIAKINTVFSDAVNPSNVIQNVRAQAVSALLII